MEFQIHQLQENLRVIKYLEVLLVKVGIKNNQIKYDEYAFLFQLNRMEIHYVIKGKGGIYCGNNYRPTFGNSRRFNLCFQDLGKSLEGKNREDAYDYSTNSFENNLKQN